MKYWLMKSEPGAYSIDDLERDGSTSWNGIRNFQARNFMRDEMRVGGQSSLYASSAIRQRFRSGRGDCEARPEPKDPTWSMVDIRFVSKFPEVVPLETLKKTRGLGEDGGAKRSRLSIQPVTKSEYDIVVKLGTRGR